MTVISKTPPFAFTTLIGNYSYCEGCFAFILREINKKLFAEGFGSPLLTFWRARIMIELKNYDEDYYY
jgi:Na+/alanine symporter